MMFCLSNADTLHELLFACPSLNLDLCFYECVILVFMKNYFAIMYLCEYESLCESDHSKPLPTCYFIKFNYFYLMESMLNYLHSNKHFLLHIKLIFHKGNEINDEAFFWHNLLITK